MAEYNTEQKKLIIDFLKQHCEESFTIEEIEQKMRSDNMTVPGLSTIYRIMPKLVEEGVVKRFSGDKKRRFLYQIVDGEHCQMHLHMKCTECGKLLHMNDGVSQELLDEIFKASNFSVDRGKTVLFGQCYNCKK